MCPCLQSSEILRSSQVLHADFASDLHAGTHVRACVQIARLRSSQVLSADFVSELHANFASEKLAGARDSRCRHTLSFSFSLFPSASLRCYRFCERHAEEQVSSFKATQVCSCVCVYACLVSSDYASIQNRSMFGLTGDFCLYVYMCIGHSLSSLSVSVSVTLFLCLSRVLQISQVRYRRATYSLN